ncbi:MAG TPA: c-type cytochrome [Noviherbaspirillum sp.]|uniref:c-type cytochrome n=1 Tax=Noviherbaspirillum sp. TaxID=1926288 RepID=UPI002B48EECE|nr:c-type cytochrome [Noviherbaspirillum sp.]HJV85074.1 c-type cytochrome [Noviherbaspirillum sp.]
MKASKILPFLMVAMLAACGKKEEAPAPAPAEQTPPAASAPAASAPAAETPAPAASAPAASAPAEAAPAASAPAASGAASASAAAGGGDLAMGEKVYNTTCVSCHGAGVLGAPKFGDKAAWQPRIAQGKDTLYNHALNGFKMMPPRGGNAALKDDEVKAAIDYMVSKAS